MKCRNCGREINDTAAFCGHCNAIVKPEQRKIAPQRPTVQPPVMTPPPVNNQPDDSTPVYRKWWFWTVIALLLILVVGIVFFGLFAGEDNNSEKETKPSETIASVQTDFTKPSTPAQADDEALTEVVSMIHNGSFDNFEGNTVDGNSTSSNYTALAFDQIASVPDCFDFSIGTVFTTQELYNHNEVANSNSPFPDIEGETYIFVGGTMTNTTDEEIMPTYMHLDFILNGVSVSDVYFSEIYLSNAEQTIYSDIEYLAPGETRLFVFMISVPDDVYNQVDTVEVVFGFDNELSSSPYMFGEEYCDYLYYISTDEIETM